MKKVSTHYAKTHLSKLLDEVAHGGEVIIERRGVPLARLAKIGPSNRIKRKLGFAKGRISIAEDFDAALEDLKEYH